MLVVAFGLGLLLGAASRTLAELKLRYWGLALVGYGLQVAPYPESWGHDVPIAMLLLSFVLLLAFALANVRQPGRSAGDRRGADELHGDRGELGDARECAAR